MTTILFNIKDKYWNTIHPGMSARIKHRLILVRHGESESNIELMTSGKTTEFAIDHVLTLIGKQQSQDIANFLNSKGIYNIDRVELSPLARACQTGYPSLYLMPLLLSTNIHVNFELREIYSKESYWCKIPDEKTFVTYTKTNFDDEHKCIHTDTDWLRETETDFDNRIISLMNTWKKIGSIDNRIQTLVFTHSQVISRLLSSDKSFHIANGGISILDIDENNHIHVHVANYTKHLQTPTGMHTCIF